MWGKKQVEIDNLKKKLGYAKEDLEFARNSNKGLPEITNEIVKLNKELVDTREALVLANGFNRALNEENADLARQNDLLTSVLKQLQVSVKLPVRKSGR